MPRGILFQIRGGTAADWTSTNPTLDEREPGYETDTGLLKFGDGVTAWTSLPYFGDFSSSVLGFYGTTPIAKQTVTGSKISGAALADLLTKLANLGLIVDGTSA